MKGSKRCHDLSINFIVARMLNCDRLDYRTSRIWLKIRTRLCFGFIAASVLFFSSFVLWIRPKVGRFQIFSAKQGTGNERPFKKVFQFCFVELFWKKNKDQEIPAIRSRSSVGGGQSLWLPKMTRSAAWTSVLHVFRWWLDPKMILAGDQSTFNPLINHKRANLSLNSTLNGL